MDDLNTRFLKVNYSDIFIIHMFIIQIPTVQSTLDIKGEEALQIGCRLIVAEIQYSAV